QGRAQQGQPSLDGRTMTLPRLYSVSAGDFRDVTSGGNGSYSAGVGYDLATGRGTPIVNKLVPDLIDHPAAIIATGADAGSAPELAPRGSGDGVAVCRSSPPAPRRPRGAPRPVRAPPGPRCAAALPRPGPRAPPAGAAPAPPRAGHPAPRHADAAAE